MSSKLRLGPLPDASTVKISITVPTTLKTQLDRYAEAHSKTYGVPVDAATLIPLMLTEFLSRDKEFQRSIRGGKD